MLCYFIFALSTIIAYSHTHTHARTHTRAHTRTHTHARTHTHTHTHTRTPSCAWLLLPSARGSLVSHENTCVAVCGAVWSALCCSVLQCVAVFVAAFVAVCVVVCCSVLQCPVWLCMQRRLHCSGNMCDNTIIMCILAKPDCERVGVGVMVCLCGCGDGSFCVSTYALICSENAETQ